MTDLIVVKNLTKVYRMGDVEVHALRGVSLTIREGEMVAIMGPSGSGKSTLMNIIGCLDQPSDGEYYLDGVSVADLNDNQLAEIRNQKIGFVFQQYMLLQRTTALRNVELPMLYGGKGGSRHERAMAALAAVGMDERMHHKPNELSGGQQQRVAIARALVNEPRIIMADEPTGALDTRTGEEIMGIFQKLNRDQGITVILVTHEHDVAQHAARIISVRDGVIAGDEPVQGRILAGTPVAAIGTEAEAMDEVAS
ncbi:ABC transporter ATP-binding protein [Candidatus Chloroploca asiatica]|uniref:Macrolide ABC transporter ATP-binding protein n=1 Tax=Candidatus Chloroploca asiatica TaxID=1506545 RepID=A0A2H3KNL5_9CHLR|nr:ABC transporter ATP-binding protein [Candidatus Chloroploca asiatica]PDV99776.1 macrolide ABC transporter ATP-binding protein [Candidatus Chloroploca asiatica]